MVTQNERPGFKCPYCNTVYDDKSEAEECAEDCLLDDVDPVVETTGSKEWDCDFCGKMHFNKREAEECEAEHIEKEDKYFDKYMHEESLRLLAQAAAHPNQMKLEVFVVKFKQQNNSPEN